VRKLKILRRLVFIDWLSNRPDKLGMN
jgi:hypothetical protein